MERTREDSRWKNAGHGEIRAVEIQVSGMYIVTHFWIEMHDRTSSAMFFFLQPSLSYFGIQDFKNCSAIYFDVGANRGDTIEILAKSDPSTKKSIYDAEKPLKQLGISNKDLCVLAFEPNPRHWDSLREAQNKFTHQFKYLKIMHMAVGTSEGNVTFYIDRNSTDKNQVGSSLLSAKKTSHAENGISVQTVDLISMIQSLSYYTPEIELVAKVDIEGFEYDLLSSMLLRGSVCAIKVMLIEFHPTTKFKTGAFPNNIADSLKWVLERDGHCTKLIVSESA